MRGVIREPRHLGQDWLRYVPLAKGESAGGRDRFESERFAAVERHAREQLRIIDSPPDLVDVDMPTLRELWCEVTREMKLNAPLRELPMIQMTMDELLSQLENAVAGMRVGAALTGA